MILLLLIFYYISPVFSQIYGGVSADSSFNANVQRFVYLNNTLYICGSFTNITSTLQSPGIVNYDLNNFRWINLTYSVTASGGIMDRMATDGINIYVSGPFTNINGIPMQYVAKWDGNNWTSLGKSTDTLKPTGSARVLIYTNNTLWYLGESITNGIARWNTTTNKWNSIPSLSILSGSTSPIWTAVWYNNTLVISGSHTSATFGSKTIYGATFIMMVQIFII